MTLAWAGEVFTSKCTVVALLPVPFNQITAAVAAITPAVAMIGRSRGLLLVATGNGITGTLEPEGGAAACAGKVGWRRSDTAWAAATSSRNWSNRASAR